MNRFVKRPDWTESKKFIGIDLSKNVHYDQILNQKLIEIQSKNKLYFNYPDDYQLYKAISKYYDINIENLAIGFGATDIIYRTLQSLPISKLYIVKPSFAMVNIYCEILGIKYEFINFNEISKIKSKNSSLYLVSPNGNNGQVYNAHGLIHKFKFLICDEVYGDFYDKYSLLKLNLKNLIVIKSLSKSLGLAGLRVGFSKSSLHITKKIQNCRLSQIASSHSCYIIPKIIGETKKVIRRMNTTKKYLENKYKCKKSFSNYVLFESKNKYTRKFKCKKIDGYYRMALTDMETLDGS